MTLVSDVTYFARDIAPFIKKLEAASRRRVMISLWSEPPPNLRADAFRLVYDEDQEQCPGHQHLLPVLWEMGILPDIRILPRHRHLCRRHHRGRSAYVGGDAVGLVMAGQWLNAKDRERAVGVIESQFQEFFEKTPKGFQPLWRSDARVMLITWEPNQG